MLAIDPVILRDIGPTEKITKLPGSISRMDYTEDAEMHGRVDYVITGYGEVSRDVW